MKLPIRYTNIRAYELAFTCDISEVVYTQNIELYKNDFGTKAFAESQEAWKMLACQYISSAQISRPITSKGFQ
jgi:hypothetical protein